MKVTQKQRSVLKRRQILKNTALNDIRRIVHPKSDFGFSPHPGDGTHADQISSAVIGIIDELNYKLNKSKVPKCPE